MSWNCQGISHCLESGHAASSQRYRLATVTLGWQRMWRDTKLEKATVSFSGKHGCRPAFYCRGDFLVKSTSMVLHCWSDISTNVCLVENVASSISEGFFRRLELVSATNKCSEGVECAAENSSFCMTAACHKISAGRLCVGQDWSRLYDKCRHSWEDRCLVGCGRSFSDHFSWRLGTNHTCLQLVNIVVIIVAVVTIRKCRFRSCRIGLICFLAGWRKRRPKPGLVLLGFVFAFSFHSFFLVCMSWTVSLG